MGMTRAEIDRRLESIVAFAEIGPFMDTSVKRYSSGMSVRLAFAVAAARRFSSVETDRDGRGRPREPGRYVSSCERPVGLRNGGRHPVSVFAERGMGRAPFFELTDVLSFMVHIVSGVGSMGGETRQGVGLAECPWEIREAV